MIRAGISVLLSGVLLYFQSIIVMQLNEYSSIYFPNVTALCVLLAVNFLFAFSILTKLKPWLIRNKIWEASSADDQF